MNKVVRIISGLAEALGLEGATRFDVLKTAAEALGCVVAPDGTTTVQGEEASEGEGAPPRRKRARNERPGEGDPAERGEEEGSEGKLVEEEDEEEPGVGCPGGASDGENSSADEEDFLVQPISIEDPRRAEEVRGPDEIAVENYDDVFQWLISPLDAETFMDAICERQPAVVSRPHNRTYFGDLLGKAEIDQMLRNAGGLQYTYNVDVTNYEDGQRVNYNYNEDCAQAAGAAEGAVADADVVWRRHEQQGCSVRLLHPQRSSDALWRLMTRLEGYWQSCVGCNAYLTPQGAQGFAPHWDDIDAFVLQVEGSKRWRVYAPTAPEHVLPRYSSRDFSREELGECVLDVVLQPGDLLYMPRGAVHEAQSLPDTHSLHLTLSANQQRTWGVLLEELLPRAIKQAAKQTLRLRRCLPRGFADYMGAVRAQEVEEVEEEERMREELRAAFQQQARLCMEVVVGSLDLDWAADHLAEDFMLTRLPPPLPPLDEAAASGSKPNQLSPRRPVCMVLPGVARLVVDEDAEEPVALVCHCLSNSRAQHAAAEEGTVGGAEAEADAVPPQIEFPLGCVETLAALLAAERECVVVSDLPDPDTECGVGALQVAQALADAGLLVRV